MANKVEKQDESVKTDEVEKSKSPKTMAFVIYILQLVSLLNGISLIIAVVLAYTKVDDAKEPEWMRSHYRWQIKTFWMFLILSVVGFITIFLGIGYFILLFTLIWFLYRVVKGMLRLSEDKPIG